MKQIPSLNALKLLAALAVVVMHAKVPVLSSATLPLCKLAVPLFLMTSGYCLMDDGGEVRRDSIRRAIPRIARITIGANLLYIIYNVLLGLTDGTTMVPLLRLMDSRFWTDLLCFGGTVSGHLWYLVAYLQVLIFLWLFATRSVPRWVYWCIPLGLLLNLAVGNYGFLFDLHTRYQTSRNFFTIALPCVALGMLIRQTQPRWQPWLNTTSRLQRILCPSALVALLYAEAILYKMYCPEHTADVWLLTIPTAAVLLLACIVHPEWGSGRLADWGRRWSLPIYIYHMMLLEAVSRFLGL